MKKAFKRTLSLILALSILFSISIPVYAGYNDGILSLDTDSTGHQALTMSVDSVASKAPLQAFCVGWHFEFSSSSGSVSVDIELSEVDTNGGRRDYVFPITPGWTKKDATGIKGAKSIFDKVSDKALFNKIIKEGCTVTANAKIRKYKFSNNKPIPLDTYAYCADDIATFSQDSKGHFGYNETTRKYYISADGNYSVSGGDFKEFSDNFIVNTRNDYYDLSLTLKPEPPVLLDPKVNLTLPINGSTVLQGTVVTFKGFGTGVHHMSGFVDGQLLEEQSNPNEIDEQMKFETTVKLDEVRDYKFQIKGRNTPKSSDTGSKLAESAIHTVHVIKPPANSGSIYIKCFDIDTNKEITDTAQTFPGVEYGKPKVVNYPSVTAYKVQGSYQTFSTVTPDKTKMQTATSQTVTLSSINKNAYVYFWYKSNPDVPPVKPPVDSNGPPTAIINNTALAYAGDDVKIDGSASYDDDGYVERYYWGLEGAADTEFGDDKATISTWYPNVGVYGIDLEAVDDDNASGYDQSVIEIIEPKPSIDINVIADKMKENRKITLDLSNSKSSKRFPINWSLTTWKIDPAYTTGASGDFGVRLQDGTVYKNVNGKAQLYNGGSWTDTGKDFNSVLTGQKTVQFQARDSGQYKVTVSMANGSYSNTLDRTITVVEDLAPIANYSVPKRFIRDLENPRDPKLQTWGICPVTCTTVSPDGDPIGKRNWSMRYDADNDSRFEDMTVKKTFSNDSTIYPYTGSDPFLGELTETDHGTFMSGMRLVVDGDKDSVAEIWTFEVGVYALGLEAFEDIPDKETVKELLKPTDYKSSYVNGWESEHKVNVKYFIDYENTYDDALFPDKITVSINIRPGISPDMNGYLEQYGLTKDSD